MTQKTNSLLFGLLILISAFLFNQCNTNTTDKKTITIPTDTVSIVKKPDLTVLERSVRAFEKNGFSNLDVKMDEVFVETIIWNDMPYQLKKDVCMVLATYCGAKDSSDYYNIVVKDKYSGKTLAELNGTIGFKVY